LLKRELCHEKYLSDMSDKCVLIFLIGSFALITLIKINYFIKNKKFHRENKLDQHFFIVQFKYLF